MLAALFLSSGAQSGFDEGLDALDSRDHAKALGEFKPLAIKGNAAAQRMMGRMYEGLFGGPEDLRQAVFWYRKAAEQGDEVAQGSLGEMYRSGRGVPMDARQAVIWIRRAAEQGNAPAQDALGSMYEAGEGLPQDQRQAVDWYTKAAEQGDIGAQITLGTLYQTGRGLAKDELQAASWYRKAAEQGNKFAQFNLGVMYETGRGLPKDDVLAAVWFRKSADRGFAAAQNNLGAMYSKGQGVPKDDWAAVSWYRRAAEQGEVNAQFSLGSMYGYGRGVEKDDQQALIWFRKAAEMRHPDAYVALGVMYNHGRGVPKDAVEAVAWFRKAADQGNAAGQFSLGLMYDAGRGVPKDQLQAYFWWLLAAANGDEAARTNRDIQETILTREQRAEAQASARAWKPVAIAAADQGDRAPRVADATGSGFRVSSDLFVTNQHVIDGCQRIVVAGGTTARPVASDARNDLALLSANAGQPSAIAQIRNARPQIGEQIVVAGYPLRGVLSGINVTAGNLSSLAGIGGDTRFVQISAPVQPGNSGGPLLDGSGNVIGVVVSKLDAVKVAKATGDIPQNVNFAITANVLRGFLDSNGVDYKSSVAGPPISTQEIARRAQSFTVSIECWK